MSRRTVMSVALLVAAVVGAAAVARYPLDAYDATGIRRLRVYRLINEGQLPGNLRFRPGATLPTEGIRLRMAGVNDHYDITRGTPPDPVLQAGLDRIFADRDPSYRIALLDITDPRAPRFAAIRPDQGYIPGSVGKIVVMHSAFDQLARRHPADIAARVNLLKNTWVTADDWVIPNSHQVPVVNDDLTGVVHRALLVGDRFTLWEWIDHMVSPSSNAAGSIVWKQVMLMDAFGSAYPDAVESQAAFFRNTPRAELGDRSARLMDDPLVAAGIDTAGLNQRTMFTNTSQRAVPGRGSHSTPRQLVRWLLKLEQGKLVDEWSSLEMKKLLYFTRRRYRFAAAASLDSSAVFFKSGSLYQCQPEPGFQCGQYLGNRMNLMHSVAIVETRTPAGEPNRVYLMSMMSNVLRVNSASEHATIAAQIDRLVRRVTP